MISSAVHLHLISLLLPPPPPHLSSLTNMDAVNKVGTVFLRAILLRMKELGLNKSALARRMNVSRAYVTQVLQGKEVNFSFATAMRFASALELDFFPQPRRQRPKKSSAIQLQTPNFKLQTLSPSLALA